MAHGLGDASGPLATASTPNETPNSADGDAERQRAP